MVSGVVQSQGQGTDYSTEQAKGAIPSDNNNMMQPPRFTQEQYKHIYKMLEQDENKIYSHTHAAHMAGSIRDLITINDSPEWIIDTGATNHMTSNIELLEKKIYNSTSGSKESLLTKW